MKWIGQNIYDFISRFRNDVYLESISSGTIASGGNLGLDSNNKIVKAAVADGDITGVTAGTGLSGGGSSGAVTLNLDLTSSLSDATPAHGDGILMLDSDGNTEQMSSVEDLATLYAGTGLTASSSVINVDAAQSGITSLGTLTGLTIDGDKSVTPGDGAMLHIDTSTITDNNTSASGTASLYTHARIEGPTLAATNASVTTTDAATLYVTRPGAGTNQTLSNIWGIYTNGATHTLGLTNSSNYSQTAGDMSLYDATNDGNPTISLGSSATERLEISARYESGAQGLDEVRFTTYTAGSSANDGRFTFYVDETNTIQIKDSLLNIMQNGKLTIGNVDILSDSSGTTTLNNIDALDATTETTIESAIDTLGNLTSASSLATVGTISSGTWQGTAIASAYLDADTAHLSGTQTFTGAKTFDTAIATDSTKHLIHYDFQGYGTGDGTNFEISKQVSVNTAPFNHDTSIGSDGLTAQTVQTWIRADGKVMPKACTLKRITGWSAAAGSSTANIGLFKVTPTRNNNSNVSAVELADISYTALGNAKMEDHDVTSFTATAIAAGDILFTAIKAESGAIQYFSLTVEVEF